MITKEDYQAYSLSNKVIRRHCWHCKEKIPTADPLMKISTFAIVRKYRKEVITEKEYLEYLGTGVDTCYYCKKPVKTEKTHYYALVKTTNNNDYGNSNVIIFHIECFQSIAGTEYMFE